MIKKVRESISADHLSDQMMEEEFKISRETNLGGRPQKKGGLH
jgi:hypothetical protein